MKKKIGIGLVILIILITVGTTFLMNHKADNETSKVKKTESLEKPDEEKALQKAEFEIIDDSGNYNDEQKEALKKEITDVLDSFGKTMLQITDNTPDYSNTLTAMYGTGDIFKNSNIEVAQNAYKELTGIHMKSDYQKCEPVNMIIRGDVDVPEVSVIGAYYVKASSDRMEQGDYVIPFNAVLNNSEGWKVYTVAFTNMYVQDGFAFYYPNDRGDHSLLIKGSSVLTFDFQNVDDFIQDYKYPEGHSFNESDYEEKLD